MCCLRLPKRSRPARWNWTDPLTITEEAKAVGSAGLEELPPGAQVSVRKAAQQMISASDNMATDLLIARLGPGAVERALVSAGHHDPASMTPFPTMHELFSVGWGEPDLREQWKQASPQGRAQLLEQTNSRPYQPDPVRTHTPASSYGAEWYGSAADICRVHAALQAAAVRRGRAGAGDPVGIPGIDLDESKWPYIGAKGGNLPGDLTFSWYAVDHTGQPWVVSFQLNWPRYPQSDRRWLAAVDRAPDLRPGADGASCAQRHCRYWVVAQDLSDPSALMGLCPRPHHSTLRWCVRWTVLEVLFEELGELMGQRNAIDGRIVEIVAEMDHDNLVGITGARSIAALVAWKTGSSARNAEKIATIAQRLPKSFRAAWRACAKADCRWIKSASSPRRPAPDLMRTT